jgi:hypothetical protein
MPAGSALRASVEPGEASISVERLHHLADATMEEDGARERHVGRRSKSCRVARVGMSWRDADREG